MVMINAKRLESLWIDDKHPLVRPGSLDDTKWILDAAIGETPVSEVSLTRPDVRDLIDGLFEHRQATERPITRKTARARVNRLLEHLNEVPGMNAVLIPEPTTVHRPTALPSTANGFVAARQMVALDRQLLGWCRQVNTLDAWLLVLAIRLMTRLGMSESVALGSLAQLTLEHIDNTTLEIPSSPNAIWPRDGHYRLALPNDLWIPLRAIVTRETGRPTTEWLLAPDALAIAMDVKQRRQEVRERLKAATRQMLADLAPNGKSSYPQLKSWPGIANVSRNVPVLRGIPPLWSTVLREYPLPTCTPTPLRLGKDGAHRYSPGNLHGRLPDRIETRGAQGGTEGDAGAEVSAQDAAGGDAEAGTDVPADPPESATRPAGVFMIPTEHLPADWRRKTKNILQQFLFDVSLLLQTKVKAKGFEIQMQEILIQYENHLNHLMAFTGHYPVWVLHFLYHRLRKSGIKISTAKTQLSRLTPLTLLLHDAVLDLGDWDDDVVLELEIAAKTGSHWKPATLEAFRVTFRQFMKFCQRFGMLEDVTLPRHSSSVSPSVLRTRIISPDHMDTMWESFTRGVPNGDPRQMMAVVIALGFYGGLRASESESLTLSTIQFGAADDLDKSTCWIDILGGKTAAARRRVALHVMAPPSVVRQMRGWVAVRREECAGQPLADIALFGPRHSPEAYTRRHLITPAIDQMREVLGEDIDFHGLRHAAVSWTLLRLHAVQFPGFSETLQHRHHWMFQAATLQDTRNFFCGAEGNDTLERGTLLLHVSKWIGHRDPRTLLENYAHTLGLIHSDILAPSRR